MSCSRVWSATSPLFSVLAALVLSLSGPHAGQTAPVSISSVSTSTVNGISTFRAITDGDPADVTYTGEQWALDSFTAGLDTYYPEVTGSVFVRRNSAIETFSTSNANQVTTWTYELSNDLGAPPNIEVAGEYLNTFEGVLGALDIRTGGENILVNSSTGGVTTNVERIDFIFDSSIEISADHSIAALDRGGPVLGANKGFGIAAITGMGVTLPNGFGTPVQVPETAYDPSPALVAAADYNIYRYEVAGGPELDRRQANASQEVVGISIPATDLVSVGTTIYGYSIFAQDVTALIGADLIDWNSAFFPTNTTTTDGDVDFAAIGSILWTNNPVPEPSSSLLVFLAGAGAFLIRRRAP